MSREYDLYLAEHIANVQKGWIWMQENLLHEIEDKIRELYNIPDNETPFDIFGVQDLVEAHDRSKTDPEEYYAYDEYFYGPPAIRGASSTVQEFQKAFLLHLHKNPHHWQYWVLTHVNNGEPETVIEMPLNYIFEMICDWWTFSWRKGDLTEIFEWWDEHKNYINLHKRTRKVVELILNKMKDILEKEEYENSLSHADDEDPKYGIPEQKKYPMPDPAHVRSAIRFFNYVDPKHEEELAKAILARMKEYQMSFNDFGVGDENRFKKYIPKIEEKG